MQLLAIGINHNTAPVSLRERVAFPLEQIKPALGALRTQLAGKRGTEAAILSTCNRTEIYCATDLVLSGSEGFDHTLRWLAQHHNIPASELAPHLYALPQSEAVRHAFRVLTRNGRPTRAREWQDTVLMAPDERVEVAFVADSPGDWMLHCHILDHQEGGMMAVVRVA